MMAFVRTMMVALGVWIYALAATRDGPWSYAIMVTAGFLALFPMVYANWRIKELEADVDELVETILHQEDEDARH